MLTQIGVKVNEPIHTGCIHYNKTFDRVIRNHPIRLLRDKNVDKKDMRILVYLYTLINRPLLSLEKTPQKKWKYKELDRDVCPFYYYWTCILNKSSKEH